MSMKTLINNLVAMTEAAVTAGTIVKPSEISAIKVFKGFRDAPTSTVTQNEFYIAIDENGERIENTPSKNAQKRIYSVMFELGVYAMDAARSLDYILDLSDNLKTVVEALANRKLDGHIYAKTINPMSIQYDTFFFRGRQIQVDYFELEDRVNEY